MSPTVAIAVASALGGLAVGLRIGRDRERRRVLRALSSARRRLEITRSRRPAA